MENKNKFMTEAIRLSLKTMRDGHGGPFGAVIVKKGRIISRGFNRVTSTNDPSAHAEVVAIREACKKLKTFQLKGCELYTSCEPCPMCLGAVYWAGIGKIYYANTKHDAHAIGFSDKFIYEEFAKPLSKRKLRIKQKMRGEALGAFKEWLKKEGKIRY